MGHLEAFNQVYPDAKYQGCTVHVYRNVFTGVPRKKSREVAAMLKAIYAQENQQVALEKAKSVVQKLKEMRLKKAVKKAEASIAETATYMDFPSQQGLKIRSNNAFERWNREIRRRTRVVGAFLDGESALMLVFARLRYMEDRQWGCKRYLNRKHLEAQKLDALFDKQTVS
ncbi:hypothetical protein ABB02_01220 [Clostridiaceae bacterium JG1575]|nr:hypothetical protein ABB02_01220 [Clostridiaceae bacterium JG1575]